MSAKNTLYTYNTLYTTNTMRTDPMPDVYSCTLQGYDYNRYRIIGWVPQGLYPVTFQESIDDGPKHYCVRYRGSGHYYSTMEEALAYYAQRFNEILTVA